PPRSPSPARRRTTARCPTAPWTWPRPRSSVTTPRASGPRTRPPPRPRLRSSAEDDLGDLGRSAEAHRRSPVAGPARDIQMRLAVLHQPGDVRLLQLDQVVPGPDLSAVGVSGELHVDAEARGFVDRLGLVREQHARARFVAAGERLLQIGAVPGGEAARRVVVDAG